MDPTVEKEAIADQESIDAIVRRALRRESVNRETDEGQGAEKELAASTAPPAHQEMPHAPASSTAAPWTGIIVQVLAIALISSGITLAALKLTGALAPAPLRVVTFDVLKYQNAERAAAMQLMGENGAGAVAPMLSYTSKRLRAAVQAAAGPSTLVVLSQAIVQGATRDVTDQVLKELGLPTKVPTADPVKTADAVAGTVLPPIEPSAASPLARLIKDGEQAKNTSIVP